MIHFLKIILLNLTAISFVRLSFCIEGLRIRLIEVMGKRPRSFPMAQVSFLILNLHKKFFFKYLAKDGGKKEVPALEWLAAMCSHIPNRSEQMARSQGFYRLQFNW
jgi:hypothetical protein